MTKITRKYEVTFSKHKARLVVTYYNNNFKKLEYVKGGYPRGLHLAIGKAIPLYESEIKAHLEKFSNAIRMDLIQDKSKSLYSQFIEEYFGFYEGLSDGVKPKMDGAQGKAMNTIISYLQSQSIDDEEALLAWQQILSGWNQLDDFYQNQIKLTQINSNINNIILQIKNGKSTNQARKKAQRNGDDFRQSL
jgi:hypothetical protein